MKKFTDWMEQKFVPKAAKIASQRFLVAIKDSFIAIMPITMVGSIAVLLNVFFRDLPRSWGQDSFVELMTPLININGIVWFASIAILSLAFVIALGYNVAKSYEVNPVAGALVAFASFVAFLPQEASFEAEVNGVKQAVSSWGFINVDYLGAKGLFPAMIIGLVSTIIYSKLMKSKLTIKLPDSVPPAVSKAFASIIPGVVAIYVCAILSHVIVAATGSTLNDLIAKYIQAPLLGLSQGMFSVVLLSFLVQLFWFFGLMFQLYIVYRLFIYRRHWGWTFGLMLVCTAVQLLMDPEGEVLNRYRYNFMGGMLPFGFGILYARYGQMLSSRTVICLFVVSILSILMGSTTMVGWTLVPLFVCIAAVTLVKLITYFHAYWLQSGLVWVGGVSAALFVCHPITRKIFIPLSRQGDYYVGLLLYVVTSLALAWFFRELMKRIPSL